MDNTYTIELGSGNDSIRVTLEYPGDKTAMQLLTNAPEVDEYENISAGNYAQLQQFVQKLVFEVSDYPSYKLDMLSPESKEKLLVSCVQVLAGNNPHEEVNGPLGSSMGTDQYKVETTEAEEDYSHLDLEFDEDGSLARNDWR